MDWLGPSHDRRLARQRGMGVDGQGEDLPVCIRASRGSFEMGTGGCLGIVLS
jgi:hypothetical protein